MSDQHVWQKGPQTPLALTMPLAALEPDDETLVRHPASMDPGAHPVLIPPWQLREMLDVESSAAPQAQEAVLHCAPWWRMLPYWLRLRPGVTMDCGAYVTQDAHLADDTPCCVRCDALATGPISEGNYWPIRQRWALFS